MEVRSLLTGFGKQNGYKLQTFGKVDARRCVLVGAAAAGMWLGSMAQAQVVKAPRYQGTQVEAPVQQINLPPLPAAITPHGVVVEDVVVRVNDQIISRSDVERAEEQLEQDGAQNHVPAGDLALQQRNMLRDMIDKQLLLSRAKELGLNADADVIRQLDEIRKQNKMDSLDDLEKAAKAQGVSFEDFKAQIRNQILTQQVVRDEVGRRLQLSQADEAKFYEEHKNEFTQPEQIRLSEILVPLPDTATPAQIAQAEAKANDIKTKVMQGDSFADLAKKYSGGPSAAQGGELGQFKRGALAKVLEDQTFSLNVGESTQPIRTRQGFVILKVTGHDQAGPSPMKDVEPQIQEAMYMQAMQPALRTYLTKLREEAYIDVQPGFVDSGASAKESKPVFSAYAPPVPKKKPVKQAVRFDRTGHAVAEKAVVASPDTTGGRTLTGSEANTAIDLATGLAAIPATAPALTPGSKTNVSKISSKTGKVKVAKREKIRFGQAPRNSLPSDGTEVATTTTDGGAVAAGSRGATLGSATTPGVPTTPAAPETTASLDDNALTPKAVDHGKTRFAARAEEVKERKATTLTAKQAEKVNAKPVALTPQEAAAAKVQAAPLGLAGDTSKKPKKPKKDKNAPKARLEDKQPVAKQVATPVDQTASPSLAPTDAVSASPSRRDGTAPAAPTQSQQVPNSSVPRPASNIPNDTTLPPVTQPVPGSPQQGTPVPPPGL